jgi:hypothetical protein
MTNTQMKTTAVKHAVAFALVSAFVLSVATVSLTGAASAQNGCVQQYDTSGTATAPYCK